VSNWARTRADRCRHNEGYWGDSHWWGVGPGAHSHIGGIRWWNVRHPNAFATRLNAGLSPAAGRELLTSDQRYDERVLLGTRLVDGLPIDELRPDGASAVAGLIAEELIEAPSALGPRRVVLTLRGRLLADVVVRRLLAF
jgi:oxygen-independent coproporphyrinogen-3 oxidase